MSKYVIGNYFCVQLHPPFKVLLRRPVLVDPYIRCSHSPHAPILMEEQLTRSYSRVHLHPQVLSLAA